jgi:hypothetical protein
MRFWVGRMVTAERLRRARMASHHNWNLYHLRMSDLVGNREAEPLARPNTRVFRSNGSLEHVEKLQQKGTTDAAIHIQ